MAVQFVVTKTLAAADDDNVAASQTPLASGNLTLNGVAATGSPAIAVLDTQRHVIITSAGNDSGITFTIYGTNQGGIAIFETVTGANIGIATSVLDYKTVTRVAVSAATAAAVKVGTNGVGATEWFALNKAIQPDNLSVAVVVTGTVNYTGQYTYDDLNCTKPGDPVRAGNLATIQPTLWSDPSLTAQTATMDSTMGPTPIFAYRVLINSGTGSIKATITQAGIAGPH